VGPCERQTRRAMRNGPDALPIPLKEGSLRRRPWLILGGFSLLLLGLLVWLFLFNDGPLPDDSDMMPTWSDREEARNPLAVCLAELQKSKLAKDSVPWDDSRDDFPERIEAYLYTHKDALINVDILLHSPPTKWQWPGIRNILTSDKPQDYFRIVQQVGGALAAKARHTGQRGEVPAAVDACITLARFGHGLQYAEGGTIHLLIAMALQRVAVDNLKDTLTLHVDAVKPETLRHCLQELSRLQDPPPELIQNALKIRYQWIRRCTLEPDMRNYLMQGKYLGGHQSYANLFLFKPNRTLQMQLNAVREVVNEFPRGEYALAFTLELGSRDLESLESERDKLQFLMDPNLAGKHTVITERTQLNRLMLEVLMRRVGHRQTLTMLALRLHELEKGSLPKDLHDLVPTYLSAMPEDPFSKGSLKWNAKKAIVYSVGADLRDDGGHFSVAKSKHSKDACEVYWWAKSTAKPNGAP
jgi:hypothetical protein